MHLGVLGVALLVIEAAALSAIRLVIAFRAAGRRACRRRRRARPQAWRPPVRTLIAGMPTDPGA